MFLFLNKHIYIFIAIDTPCLARLLCAFGRLRANLDLGVIYCVHTIPLAAHFTTYPIVQAITGSAFNYQRYNAITAQQPLTQFSHLKLHKTESEQKN